MHYRAVILLLIFSPTSFGWSDPPLVPEESDGSGGEDVIQVKWQEPYTTLSSINGTAQLIMMLVTDDQAFAQLDSRRVKRREPWCATVIAQSLSGLLRHRPALKRQLSLEHLPVGTPAILCGGNPLDVPSGAMVFVLNTDHQVLAWMIGVPESDSLISLIEDAEEVQLLLGRFVEEPQTDAQ